MKKNGFTLVELLATLTLMGILATIVINYSIKNTNRIKEESKATMIKSIETAAENYAINNSSSIDNFNVNDYAYVTLETLINNNQFSSSLIDQTTDLALPMLDTVYITKSSNGIIKAVYDIDQNTKPRITLNGPYNIYLKRGNEYTELGVTAISSTGSNITSSVVTTGTVNVNLTGNYVITYTVDETSITRNIIVY